MLKKFKLSLSKSLCITITLVVFLSIITLYPPSPAHSTNPGGSLIGVVRWDGQVGQLHVNPDPNINGVGIEEERAMAPNKWHFRIPFYATEPTVDSVTMRATTQTIIDQEIAYAKEAGINYWAFCWYPPGHGLETARNLYVSSTSPYKNDVKMSVILFTNPMSSTDIDWLVARFQNSYYQKVLGGRPLVYAYNYATIANAAQITELRTKSAAAGVPDPYVVAMDYGVTNATNFANLIGANAISTYVTSGSSGQTYSTLATTERSNWDAHKSTGKKVIPWVTAGWDTRPRGELSPAYAYADASYLVSTNWARRPTPSELSNQLQSAIDWNANPSNATAAEANAVLMYAWNEFSEGGYIAPLKSGSGINRDYLDAVKSVTTTITSTSGSNTSFVTGKTLTTLRNNYDDYVGMKITIGSSPITVSQLGRYYVPVSVYTSIKDWNFNTAANFEGWTMYYQVSGTVSGGALNLTTSGTDPIIMSPDNLGITSPATYNKIRIRMKNNTSQTSARVYFITNADTTWGTAGKYSSVVTIIANSNYTDYVVDMSGVTVWTGGGTIKQIRIDPLDPAAGSGQTVNIDYIRVTTYNPGNSRNHILKIVKAADNTDVASTIINMGAGTADLQGFKYAALSSPVTLAANTSYYIVSSESSGGDLWYDGNSSVTTTSAATVNNAVYRNFDYTSGIPTGKDVYNLYLSSGNSYVPLNFRY